MRCLPSVAPSAGARTASSVGRRDRLGCRVAVVRPQRGCFLVRLTAAAARAAVAGQDGRAAVRFRAVAWPTRTGLPTGPPPDRCKVTCPRIRAAARRPVESNRRQRRRGGRCGSAPKGAPAACKAARSPERAVPLMPVSWRRSSLRQGGERQSAASRYCESSRPVLKHGPRSLTCARVSGHFCRTPRAK